MITDKLENGKSYYGLGEKIERSFKYLEKNDLSKMECGRYEIDGSDIFISIDEYNGKNIEDCLWEAHKKYIDIQYIVKGKEKIGYINDNEVNVTVEYDEERDIYFGSANGQFINLNEGEFIIFMPNDAHMPSIKVNEEKIKKAVVKIRI